MNTANILPSKRKAQAPLDNDSDSNPADDISVHSMSSVSQSSDAERDIVQDIEDLDFDDFESNSAILKSWNLHEDTEHFVWNEVIKQQTDCKNESDYYDEALKRIKKEIEYEISMMKSFGTVAIDHLRNLAILSIMKGHNLARTGTTIRGIYYACAKTIFDPDIYLRVLVRIEKRLMLPRKFIGIKPLQTGENECIVVCIFI